MRRRQLQRDGEGVTEVESQKFRAITWSLRSDGYGASTVNWWPWVGDLATWRLGGERRSENGFVSEMPKMVKLARFGARN